MYIIVYYRMAIFSLVANSLWCVHLRLEEPPHIEKYVCCRVPLFWAKVYEAADCQELQYLGQSLGRGWSQMVAACSRSDRRLWSPSGCTAPCSCRWWSSNQHRSQLRAWETSNHYTIWWYRLSTYFLHGFFFKWNAMGFNCILPYTPPLIEIHWVPFCLGPRAEWNLIVSNPPNPFDSILSNPRLFKIQSNWSDSSVIQSDTRKSNHLCCMHLDFGWPRRLPRSSGSETAVCQMHDLGGFPGHQDSGQRYHWTLMKAFTAIVEGSQRRSLRYGHLSTCCAAMCRVVHMPHSQTFLYAPCSCFQVCSCLSMCQCGLYCSLMAFDEFPTCHFYLFLRSNVK